MRRGKSLTVFWAAVLIVVLFAPNTTWAHGEINPVFAEHFSAETTSTPEENRRSEVRTYLTFPEWYIVYSAEEYGEHVRNGGNPSGYPYMDAISLFWQTMHDVRTASGATTIPSETKTVLDTIGLSFTVESAAIGLYECTIGRITEFLNFGKKSPEDVYADEVAYEYGQFLLTTPWYEFPYLSKLAGLWTHWGLGSITPRGIERRLAFTIGYGAKAIYGGLIKMATRAAFEAPAELETSFVAENISLHELSSVPGVTLLPTDEPEHPSAKAPRYRAFTKTIEIIAEKGGQFQSIQGNDTIMFTVLAPEGNDCTANIGTPIFSIPVLPATGMKRYAFTIPVSKISETVKILASCNFSVEHFYDY